MKYYFDHEVIGIDEHGSILTLESIHELGASGSGFDVYPLDWVRENSDVEDFFEYVDGATDASNEYKQQVTEQLMEEMEFPGQDVSYQDQWPQIMKDAGIDSTLNTLSCTRGGRIFSSKIKWKKLINPVLWERIIQAETK